MTATTATVTTIITATITTTSSSLPLDPPPRAMSDRNKMAVIPCKSPVCACRKRVWSPAGSGGLRAAPDQPDAGQSADGGSIHSLFTCLSDLAVLS